MHLNSLSTITRAARMALLAVCATAPLGVSAESRNSEAFYIGGGIGYARVESADFLAGDTFEDERVGYKGLLGMRANEVVSLEAQYVDLGTAEGGGNRVDAHGATAGIVLHVPAFVSVHPYGKAGALFWNVDTTTPGFTGNDDGTDFTYGLGLRFAMSNHLDLRTEYERFELDETDVDNVSLMLQYNF